VRRPTLLRRKAGRWRPQILIPRSEAERALGLAAAENDRERWRALLPFALGVALGVLVATAARVLAS
jgi:hypothetical protein